MITLTMHREWTDSLVRMSQTGGKQVGYSYKPSTFELSYDNMQVGYTAYAGWAVMAGIPMKFSTANGR